MKNKSTLFTIITTSLISVVLTGMFFFSSLGVHLVGSVSKSPISADYGKMMKIEKYIENSYMGEYDTKKLTDGAIDGYVDSLGDSYSGYFNQKEFKDLSQKLDGEYQGIGITVGQTDGRILVKEVNAKSPAEKAGLKAGDIILKVNGVEYNAGSLSSAINAIKSTKIGDSVLLTIERDGKSLEVNIVVQKIHQELIKSYMLSNSVGYIYISSFGKSVSQEFSKALENCRNAGMKGLVIDLRNNPGGTLDSAVEIADMLLPEGEIVSIKDKHGREEVYKSDSKCLDVPISVIVNESSASASEVLSGALRDNKWATLVGKKTFGKGVVQSVIDLGDGSGLSLTVAKYYTPSGVCIHGIGISPDMDVPLAEGISLELGEFNQADTQLMAAVSALRSQMK